MPARESKTQIDGPKDCGVEYLLSGQAKYRARKIQRTLSAMLPKDSRRRYRDQSWSGRLKSPRLAHIKHSKNCHWSVNSDPRTEFSCEPSRVLESVIPCPDRPRPECKIRSIEVLLVSPKQREKSYSLRAAIEKMGYMSTANGKGVDREVRSHSPIGQVTIEEAPADYLKPLLPPTKAVAVT